MKPRIPLSTVARTFLAPFAALIVVVLPFQVAAAEAAGSLLALYERVEKNARSESAHNREREAEFRAARDQQQRLLAEIRSPYR